ncbi:unnamed protein product [Merluccius merluccius]
MAQLVTFVSWHRMGPRYPCDPSSDTSRLRSPTHLSSQREDGLVPRSNMEGPARLTGGGSSGSGSLTDVDQR